MPFNGFISYSHAADNRLAPAIQRGLHRLAKPWHRRRALWIFRDQTGLAVTPALWSSIQNALDSSDFFVLLASPEAAHSAWVNREIEHWMATKSPDKILPVVTDGEWRWDPVHRDFNADSSAVPAALRGAFAEEPLYLDLRWARDDRHLSLRHSRFRDAIAQLAAPMHGVSKDDLEGEDVRQHRRARRLRSGALATLVLLTFVAVLTGVLAMHNANRANAAAKEAQRQQMAAVAQKSNADRFAGQAKQSESQAAQQQARAVAATAATQRQEQLAREQKSLAVLAADEAGKQEQIARAQKALAVQAKADAGREQNNAELQRHLADRATQRAQKQEELARQQRELAQRWAQEAKTEEALATKAAADAQAQQVKAEQQTRIAVGRRLVNQAKATIDGDPQTALMLGAAADEIQGDGESRREVAGLDTSTRYAGTIDGVTSGLFGAGDTVAARDDDGAVSLWNVADRSHPVKLSALTGTASIMAFSPDGRTLALSQEGHAAALWNVADPAHPVRLGDVPGPTSVSGLAFSPDSRTLAVSVQGMNTPPNNPPFFQNVQLFDVADPAHTTHLATVDLEDPADQIAFSSDSHTLVLTTLEDMEFWNVTDRTAPVQTAARDHTSEEAIASSSARPLLATSEDGDGTVVLWDLSDPAKPVKSATVKTASRVTSLAFRPDGHTLATGDTSGATTLWDMTAPSKPVNLGRVTGDDAVAELAYSADGRTLISSGIDSVTLWNSAGYGTPDRIADFDTGSQPLATAYGRDGRSVITVRSDGTASFWDLRRPRRPVPSAAVTVHAKYLNAAAISADRRTIAAAGNDDQLTLTDVADPQHPARLATVDVPFTHVHPADLVRDMAFRPDGHMLAFTTWAGDLFLYDVADQAHPRLILQRPATSAAPLGTLAFSPDGRTLAAGDDHGRVLLWSLARPSAPVPVSVLVGRRATTGASSIPVSFSPDGRTLVAGGSTNKAALLWDVTDPAHPARLAALTLADTVRSGMFSPDGHLMATGSDDHAVVLWDVTDGHSPVRLATVQDSTLGPVLAFGPDGHTVVTASTTAVTLWDFSGLNTIRANAARQACTMAGRGLTADEWARYVPEVPYVRTCQ